MNAIVIAAAGSGSRFGAKGGKTFTDICGKPMLYWSIATAIKCNDISVIIIVANEKIIEDVNNLVSDFDSAIPIKVILGGETRGKSIECALKFLEGLNFNFVSIHDGARPLVTPDLFDKTFKYLRDNTNADGVIIAHKEANTLKMANGANIIKTLDRESIWCAETPQTFRYRSLKAAFECGFDGTDDASYIEEHGGHVNIIENTSSNIKVTHAEDAIIASAIMRYRRGEIEE